MKNSYKQKQLDKKAWGNEPEWGEEEPTKLDIILALNWYNYMKTVDDAAKWLGQYKGVKVPSVLDVKVWGFLARMKSMGCQLPENIQERLDNVDVSQFKQGVVNTRKPPSRIQTHLLRAHIDEFVDHHKVVDIEDFIRKSSFPLYAIQDVIASLKAEKDEVESAIDKADSDIVEAYRVFKKKDLNAHKKYLDSLISGLENYLNNQKRVVKPRRKKAKPVSKKVEKLKYCDFDKKLNVQSLPPEKLIGAKEVWVYYGNSNAIAVMTAADDNGIDVRGTTIYNARCKAKKCGRATKDIIKSIIDGNKRSLKKVFQSIPNPEIDNYTTRFNDKTVILRIF